MGEVKSFKDLVIWQKSVALVREIYSIASLFPLEETQGLAHDMKMKALMIPAKIASGYSSYQKHEFKEHLDVVMRLCSELETLSAIGRMLGYVGKEDQEQLSKELRLISVMTYKLIKKIEA